MITLPTPDWPLDPSNLGLIDEDYNLILETTGIVLVVIKTGVFVESWVFFSPNSGSSHHQLKGQ
jgi:hypothetical protein